MLGAVRHGGSHLRDRRTVLSVSTAVESYLDISDVCLSLPSIVHRNGVERVLQLELSPAEIDALRRSAAVLRRTIHPLNLPNLRQAA